VVVPTLAAGDALADCVRSLEAQTYRRFEAIVVDNSGSRRVVVADERIRVLANDRNVGFGAAINQAYRASDAPYLATLNDDAAADPTWLEALVEAAEIRPKAGMFAPEVRLAGTDTLDSAGMLMAADGTSKQRGHGEAPARFDKERDALFPSGSAAMYRRSMLEEIGLFEESYFMYSEDTDLGLRARWAGWECAYVPSARVDHQYSKSAGRASPLKAYYVERNRIRTVIRNFPFKLWMAAGPQSLARYFWHAMSLMQGRGKAAEFQEGGHSAWMLPFLVARAHASATFRFPGLLAARRRLRALHKLSDSEFGELLERYSISMRQVAAL
jgi:GT2 family glycosyltransferase